MGRILKINLYQFLALNLVLITLFLPITSKTMIYAKSNNSSSLVITTKDHSFETIKTLAILGHNFGDSYFWIKDQLELMGCNVTTAGIASTVSSCPNKPPRPVTVNITTPEITREIIKQFDCVWIPSGAHWTYLVPNVIVHNILSMAYEEGLIVSAMCIGTLVLGYANGIVEGVKVVYYSGSFEKMLEENATIVYNTNVVSDKRIVTAGTGQFQSTNFAVYPFCVAITKAVLGYSSVVSTTFESVIGESNSNFTLIVETNNLSNIYYGNVSSAITSVKAKLNSENILLDGQFFTLNDDDEDNIYEATFTLTELDNFDIDLEVKSLAWGVESIRSVNNYQTKSFESIHFIPIFIICMIILSYYYFKKNTKQRKIE